MPIGHEQTFLQILYTDGQRTHEKMLNTTGCQENKNQNYNECQVTSIGLAIHLFKCWQKQGEIGTLVPSQQRRKMFQRLWKATLWFLKKLNVQFSHDPATPLLDRYPKEVKTGSQILAHGCPQQRCVLTCATRTDCTNIMKGKKRVTKGHVRSFHLCETVRGGKAIEAGQELPGPGVRRKRRAAV